MPFNFTLPPASVQFVTPTKVTSFTPASGDSHVRITLNMTNAVYETAGNQVKMQVQKSSDGTEVCDATWASPGGPTTFHGVTDPPPVIQCDLTPYIGIALDVFLTIPQQMTVGATVVGS